VLDAVGDLRLAARVLHVCQEPDALLLPSLALADIGHEAAELPHAAAAVAHHVDGVVHPYGRAVGGGEPVLELLIAPLLDRPAAEPDRPLPVLGMEEAQPELRLGHPALDRVAEQLLRMLADEREPSGLGVRFPQDGVEPLHEIVEAAPRSLCIGACRAL